MTPDTTHQDAVNDGVEAIENLVIERSLLRDVWLSVIDDDRLELQFAVSRPFAPSEHVTVASRWDQTGLQIDPHRFVADHITRLTPREVVESTGECVANEREFWNVYWATVFNNTVDSLEFYTGTGFSESGSGTHVVNVVFE
ncbi:hypothetical protein [Natrarchaeobaculum sulfurireducens]|uniref:hypothetical protein n=1 Tax=Natrarchaeobaculum sulfurireducens TaxID=2044521 RepID=UPI000E3C6F4F|nr:hypothetical protein [Natrarchaeobaculum sulfurireducens]